MITKLIQLSVFITIISAKVEAKVDPICKMDAPIGVVIKYLDVNVPIK